MLAELHVVNLLIVAQAKLQMGPGLTVISGETGAGKSLLLDALDLILGGRGGAGLVGPAGDFASVTGVFHVQPQLAEQIGHLVDFDITDGEAILRRRIGAQGRSQAWLNDEPISVQTLKRIGSMLVDIRVQHEHLRLADVGRQLDLIDRYGGLTTDAEAYAERHRACGRLSAELRSLEEGDQESLKELDYLRFLNQELEDLAPEAGECAQLESRQQLLAGAQEWQDLAQEATAVLIESDDSAVSQIARIGKRLAEAPDEGLSQAGQACLQAADLVQEAGMICAGAAESLQTDPAELQRVDDRLARYHDLLRKHGGTEEALLDAWSRIADRIAHLDNLDERRAQVQAELKQAQAQRLKLGKALAQSRIEVFTELAAKMHAELAELGMPKARVSLGCEGNQPGPHGIGVQEMFIATNPGLPPGRLAEVASGGESARMTLAMAVVLAEQDDTPVLVFDEVDSGVGGRLGQIMGGKLADLGQDRTVLAVTHTPQLAASADHHFLVQKSQGDDATTVVVEELTGARRRQELAEMLGGGKAADRQAEELLAKGHRAAMGGSKR